jgi:hypothetical protein
MKKIISMCIFCIFLSGCACDVKIVKEPVWTPPKITLPARPILSSDSNGSNGILARKLESDLIDITSYAKQLENIIKDIQNQPIPKELQNTSINK